MPALIRGTATQATTPASRPACCHGPPLGDVVVDAGLLGPERLTGNALAVLIVRIDREARAGEQIEALAAAGGSFQPDRDPAPTTSTTVATDFPLWTAASQTRW